MEGMHAVGGFTPVKKINIISMLNYVCYAYL
jgi:hypothetical protein